MKTRRSRGCLRYSLDKPNESALVFDPRGRQDSVIQTFDDTCISVVTWSEEVVRLAVVCTRVEADGIVRVS